MVHNDTKLSLHHLPSQKQSTWGQICSLFSKWMDESVVCGFVSLLSLCAFEMIFRTPYGGPQSILTTAPYSPQLNAWANASPLSSNCLKVYTPRWMHWCTDVFSNIARTCRCRVPRHTMRSPKEVFCPQMVVKQFRIRRGEIEVASVRTPIRWQYIQRDLKLRCFLLSLIIHVQGMLKIAVYSPQCNSTPRPSDNSCRFGTQDETRQREKRPLLVCPCQTRRVTHDVESVTPSEPRGRSTVDTTLRAYGQQIGNALPSSQMMMTHERLDVMDNTICKWSVDEFIELPAHCTAFAYRWMDRTADLLAHVHVWTRSRVWCYRTFV